VPCGERRGTGTDAGRLRRPAGRARRRHAVGRHGRCADDRAERASRRLLPGRRARRQSAGRPRIDSRRGAATRAAAAAGHAPVLGVRPPVHADDADRAVSPARNRVVVRQALPRPADLQRRALRHVRDDRRAPDPADSQLCQGHQRGQRPQRGGAGERSRAVPAGPRDRPLLYRSREAGLHRRGQRRSRGGTGDALRWRGDEARVHPRGPRSGRGIDDGPGIDTGSSIDKGGGIDTGGSSVSFASTAPGADAGAASGDRCRARRLRRRPAIERRDGPRDARCAAAVACRSAASGARRCLAPGARRYGCGDRRGVWCGDRRAWSRAVGDIDGAIARRARSRLLVAVRCVQFARERAQHDGATGAPPRLPRHGLRHPAGRRDVQGAGRPVVPPGGRGGRSRARARAHRAQAVRDGEIGAGRRRAARRDSAARGFSAGQRRLRAPAGRACDAAGRWHVRPPSPPD